MTIPAFQDFMLPMMRVLADDQVWLRRELNGQLAIEFQLTPSELDLRLKSGTQPVWENRCGWAQTYLTRAGLIQRPQRGSYRITERGHSVLDEGVDRIDLRYLQRFAEIREFRTPRSGTSGTELPGETGIVAVTPDELITQGFNQQQASLASEVLDRLQLGSPKFFEKVVVELLVAMGYGGSFEDAASVVGMTGDGGIDGIIKEDRLGLEAIYVQAKRWKSSVGRPVVAEFVGSLAARQSRKGVLITTSTFTQDAINWLRQVGGSIVLIDGGQLADLMVEHGVGVLPVQTLVLKRIDNDYFDETQ